MRPVGGRWPTRPEEAGRIEGRRKHDRAEQDRPNRTDYQRTRNQGQINKPGINRLAIALDTALAHQSTHRWGVYRNESGILEPIKTGFASKKTALAWWMADHPLGKNQVRVATTKVGYVYIDLSGSASPVTIKEED